MKRIFLLLVLTSLISCAPAQSPTPQAIAVAPTPSNVVTPTAIKASMPTSTVTFTPLPTNTQTLTDTPTQTSAPTNTLTQTPTPNSTTTRTSIPTRKPSLTAAPKPTTRPLPILRPFFETNFENGLAGFNGCESNNGCDYMHSPNAHFEIVSDPHDQDHGNYLLQTSTGGAYNSDGKFRVYPSYWPYPFREGNFSTSFDVSVSDLNPPQPLGDWQNPWLSLVSLFDMAIPIYPTYHPIAMVFLTGGQENYHLTTRVFSTDGQGISHRLDVDAPTFPIGRWVHVRVDVDANNGMVYTYQDGHLVSAGRLPDKYEHGLAGVHWGLYGTIQAATVKNDNLSLATW